MRWIEIQRNWRNCHLSIKPTWLNVCVPLKIILFLSFFFFFLVWPKKNKRFYNQINPKLYKQLEQDDTRRKVDRVAMKMRRPWNNFVYCGNTWRYAKFVPVRCSLLMVYNFWGMRFFCSFIVLSLVRSRWQWKSTAGTFIQELVFCVLLALWKL